MQTAERLAPYYKAALQEAADRRLTESLASLEGRIAAQADEVRSFSGAVVARAGVSVIAEHKRRSPSEGEIRPGSNIAWTVDQYRRGGAAAVSVLTQGEHFGGSVEDLSVARVAMDLPILRKDFISDEYQLYQAKAYGADAVLLITGGLDDRQLRNLQVEASGIGLDCLVEVHDEPELHRALETTPNLLGINNRDLTTLRVDRETTQRLAGLVPRGKGTFIVAESGYSVEEPEHLVELEQLGVEAVLMGTALMRSDNPAKALANWLCAPQIWKNHCILSTCREF